MGLVEGAEPQSLPRLELAEGGKLSGYTGCNMMSGTWRQEGGEARFGPIISTKRFCVGAGGEIEKKLMAAFAPGARGVREGGKLVLVAPSGARFEFQPAAAG